MKKYFIGKIEGQTALYCSELNEYALETEGNILCSEQDALEELFGTSDKQEIFKLADMHYLAIEQLPELSSSGLRDWILAKEPHIKFLWKCYGAPTIMPSGLLFGNDECWEDNGFYQYLVDIEGTYKNYYSTDGIEDYGNIDYTLPIKVTPVKFDF